MVEGAELPKSRKNQKTRRKGNLQILGNIGSGHHQSSRDEKNKKIKKKNTLREREKYLKPNFITEIKSKR